MIADPVSPIHTVRMMEGVYFLEYLYYGSVNLRIHKYSYAEDISMDIHPRSTRVVFHVEDCWAWFDLSYLAVAL